MSKEINLLPIGRRRQLARRFFEHALFRFSVSVFSGLVLLTVAGLAAFIGLNVGSSILFPPVGDALGKAVVDYRAETRAIGERNTLIADMVAQHEARLAWSERVPEVLALLPAGAELRQLSGDFVSRRLTLSGRAPARSALIVLEDKLKTLPWAKSIEAPVSNLLEKVSPEFTFVIQL